LNFFKGFEYDPTPEADAIVTEMLMRLKFRGSKAAQNEVSNLRLVERHENKANENIEG
jgi:hypothetical protein